MDDHGLFGIDWNGDGKVDAIDDYTTYEILEKDNKNPPPSAGPGNGYGCFDYLIGGIFIIGLIISLIVYGPVSFILIIVTSPWYVGASLALIALVMFICFRRFGSPVSIFPSLCIGFVGAIIYSLIVAISLEKEGHYDSTSSDSVLRFVSIFLMFAAYSLLGPRIRRAKMSFAKEMKARLINLLFTSEKVEPKAAGLQDTEEIQDAAGVKSTPQKSVFRWPRALPYAKGVLIGLAAALAISSAVYKLPVSSSHSKRAPSGNLLLKTKYYTLEFPDDDDLNWRYKITELPYEKDKYGREKNKDNYSLSLYGTIEGKPVLIFMLYMTDDTRIGDNWSDAGRLYLEKGSSFLSVDLLLFYPVHTNIKDSALREFLNYRQHIPDIIDSIKPVKKTYTDGKAVYVSFSPAYSGSFPDRFPNYWKTYYMDLLLME